MAEPSWADLPSKLESTLPELNRLLKTDEQFLAFTDTDAIEQPLTFGWKAVGSDNALLCMVSSGKGHVSIGKASDAKFTMCALPTQWENFYQKIPKLFYQSYWGLYGQNIHQEGVEVLGEHQLFLNYAPIWRRVLDLSHTALCGQIPEDKPTRHTKDVIVGRYIYVDLPSWGETKLFYEQSGDSSNPSILFLHTAGSDGRQYHGVMNHPEMLKRCHMTVIDLPGHGRSFPGSNQLPGRHSNNEDTYVGTIRTVIQALGLNKPIVCGASMAGHVCLAVAIRAEEVGAGGVIPCQGCEYTDMKRHDWDRSPFINQATFVPEYIYGMMSPLSPRVNRDLVWHTYSSQAYGMYHGDLDFYFGGWDGRGRVESIDCNKCPVYLLTGDYDWSNTPAMSEATAKKIPGAKFATMEGLGHFPATENPERFVKYLAEAVDWVLSKTKESVMV